MERVAESMFLKSLGKVWPWRLSKWKNWLHFLVRMLNVAGDCHTHPYNEFKLSKLQYHGNLKPGRELQMQRNLNELNLRKRLSIPERRVSYGCFHPSNTRTLCHQRVGEGETRWIANELLAAMCRLPWGTQIPRWPSHILIHTYLPILPHDSLMKWMQQETECRTRELREIPLRHTGSSLVGGLCPPISEGREGKENRKSFPSQHVQDHHSARQWPTEGGGKSRKPKIPPKAHRRDPFKIH